MEGRMTGDGAASPIDRPADDTGGVELTLRVVLEAIEDGVTAHDPLGQVRLANAAAARMTGYPSADAMIAAPPTDFLHRFELLDDDGSPLSVQELPGRRAAVEGRPVERVIRFRDRATGDERWSLVRAFPVRDTQGSVALIVDIFRDITAQVKAEEALRESEERFRGVNTSSPMGIFLTDLEGRCTYTNPRCQEICGFTADEALGMGWSRHIHAEDREPTLAAWTEATRRGESLARAIRFVHPNRGTRLTRVRTAPLRLASGRVVGHVGTVEDVTEQQRAEEQLRFLNRASELLGSSLDYHRTLATVASLCVPRLADWCAVDILEGGAPKRLAVAHQDPARVDWARELERRYPSDPAAATGLPGVLRTGRSELYADITDEMLVAGARDAEHLALLRQIGFRSAMIVPLRAGDETLGAITFVAAESGHRYGAADLAVAEDLARRAAMAIANARLFGEVQESREELEQQAEELQQTTEELEQANEELALQMAEAETARAEAEAANRAKSEFLAMMSHELRTPLNAIAGYSQILEMEVHGPITAEQREDLHRIQHNQRHLLSVINDVLNFARLEVGRVELDVQDVAVEEMLERIHELVAPQLQARAHTYRYVPGSALVTVRGDREKIRQIVLNLLGNAVKFTEPGGRILLSWEASAEVVRICVEDSGRGIEPGMQRAIFEPFVQADRSLTRDASGVGLGLSISRDLARAMGGDITVESEPGRGSTFVVTLPRGADVVR